MCRKGHPDLNILFVMNMPFRALAKMTRGAISTPMAQGMVTCVNGKLLRGMGEIFAGWKETRRVTRRLEEHLRGSSGGGDAAA